MPNEEHSSAPQISHLLSFPFVLAFFANFLTAISTHTYLHLPGFLYDLGAQEWQIGIIMGSMSAAGLLVRPALGTIMDQRGRRPPAVFGAICMTTACLLYLSIDSLGPWIYGVRVIHGVAIAALFSSLFTIAADVAPADKRAGAIALFGISGLIPIAMGGILGDLILTHGSYRTLFYTTAGTSALCLFAVLPIADTRPPRCWQETQHSFAHAVNIPALRPLWFISLGFALCVAASFTFLKTYILFINVGTVGLFFSSYAGAAVTIRLATAWRMHRITEKQALVPALGLAALGLVVLAFSDCERWLIVSGILCGFGHGLAFPTVAAMVVQRAKTSNRGAAMALFTALFDAGFLFGGPFFGLVLTTTSYRSMFVMAALLLVAMTALFLVWDRPYAQHAKLSKKGKS